MGWRALGDSAWLFETGGNDPFERLARVLALKERLETESIPEVRDLVSSFDSLAVHFDPLDGELVLDALAGVPLPSVGTEPLPGGRIIEVPMIYGGEYGPDLNMVASALDRSADEIVKLQSSAEYTVAAVGFSPGFPYLLGLPETLRLPRRATPRRVAAGSVAIAGNQAGIYPFDSQGGWHVLGRTALTLFDATMTPAALLKPGDRVRFVPVERLDFPATSSRPSTVRSKGSLEVVEPGAFTTVQDLGRPGQQSLGISPGGAADPVAARVANRLVGNPDEAAVLEFCMSGPLLRFHEAARVAWVGWTDARSGRPVEVKAGAEIDLRGRMRSVRGYVAIAGGIDVPMVLGSRATDVRAGLGGWHGRMLQAGDRLTINPQACGPKPGNWHVGWPHTEATDRPIELRFLPGIQATWFSEAAKRNFREAVYQVSPMSDRMGTCLDGPLLELGEPRELVSQPVVAGSVQVPPDGRPIVLMAERQTIGGYPQIGHVISADLPKLARAWPGTRVRFREVTLDEARAAWRDLQRELGFLQAGLDFLR